MHPGDCQLAFQRAEASYVRPLLAEVGLDEGVEVCDLRHSAVAESLPDQAEGLPEGLGWPARHQCHVHVEGKPVGELETTSMSERVKAAQDFLWIREDHIAAGLGDEGVHGVVKPRR